MDELTNQEIKTLEKHEAIRFSAARLFKGSPEESFSEFVHDFLDIEHIYYDTETSIWWHWKKIEKKWIITNETEILRIFLYELSIFKWIDPKIKNTIIDVLKVMACIKPKPLPVSWIQFKNKVVDISTKEEFQASYEYFFTNPIPFNLSDSEDTPTIDKLFTDWMNEKSTLLYEIAAYTMYRSYPIPKIFVLFGKGRNGKSQYIKFINKLIGEDNVVATSINLLSENMRFTTLRLMNKLLIQLTELESNKDFPLCELKKLTGGDLVSFEVKRGGSGQFRNFGKVIMATNNMPKITEDSDAVSERFFMIDFLNKFDPSPFDIIDTIPKEEISNFCRKCVNILPKIIESGKFSFEGTIEEKREAIQSKQHVIAKFFDECVSSDPFNEVNLSDLMRCLKEFSDLRNVSTPDESYIRYYIRNEFKGIYDLKRKKDANGKNLWVIVGVILNFLTFLRQSHLISHTGNQVEKAEKVEKCEKTLLESNKETDSVGGTDAPTTDTIRLKDTFSFADIQFTYELSPNEADKVIEEMKDKGQIMEIKPGYFKKLTGTAITDAL